MIGGEPGVQRIEQALYPKAHVLNRCIAKLIDVLIVAGADEIGTPVGFLSGLVYILIADGFAGGRSLGKRLVGLQTMRLDAREPAGFRESIIRNLSFGVAQLLWAVPYVGWLGTIAILVFEGLLVVGNEQGRRLGDEIARTQVLDAGAVAVPD